MPNFPFGEYAPDRLRADPNSSDAIANVLPTADGYRPFPSLQAYSFPLSEGPARLNFSAASNSQYLIIGIP